MTSVGNTFHKVTNLFLHGCGQREAKLLLQYERYATFTGYTVDTDNIGFVLSSHIRRIDGQIRDIPTLAGLAFLLPCHTFADGILMGTGKCGKYQISCIGHSFMYLHAGEVLISFADLHNMGEIQSTVHAVAHHVQCNSYQIHVTGTFAVAEQSTFHTVCSGQYAELRITDATAPVIVRMYAEYYIVTIFQMLVHIFYLTGKYMGHCHLYGGGQIDDGLAVSGRLPYIQYCIADFQCIIHLSLRKALRAVLKGEVAFGLVCQIL